MLQNEVDMLYNSEDITDVLNSLLCETIKEMIESEMDEHLGYKSYDRSLNTNYRNGYRTKTIHSRYGISALSVPQDRESSFQPRIVTKRQKDIYAIEDKILSLYAYGVMNEQIADILRDIYGFQISDSMILDITKRLQPKISQLYQRPLAEKYHVLFIETIHFPIRENNIIRKLATAHVILGMNTVGNKEVLAIQMCEGASRKYWLEVLENLKMRGIKKVDQIYTNKSTGIKEAIKDVFPRTEYCLI